MSRDKPGGIVVRCCVCMKERVGGEWVPPAAAAGREVSVSHSYCPECLRIVKRRLKARTTPGR